MCTVGDSMQVLGWALHITCGLDSLCFAARLRAERTLHRCGLSIAGSWKANKMPSTCSMPDCPSRKQIVVSCPIAAYRTAL